jgi:hypothetical protein
VTDPRRIRCALLTILAALLALTPCYAADTLPDRISDDAFWKLITTLSEPDGTFQSENLLSNETDFPHIMAALKRTAGVGGVYMGVGPEQNFNYIAALRPKIAFIIDIRRQNMLAHLMYKALFEMSPDRASFISRLFSRKQPPGLPPEVTAAELFDAYNDVPADEVLFQKNLKEIEGLLTGAHHFALTREDRLHLKNVYAAFHDFGPLIDYNSRGGGPSGRAYSPSYARLMTETDSAGKEWSYLANEENYRAVRDLESRNLIVPLTGDFGGPHAIRAVGQYLKDHNAVVSSFYLSNVEGYLFQGGDRRGNPNGGAARFYDNAATLPLDRASTFIRWIPGRQDTGDSISLGPILTTIDDFNAGRFTAASLFRPRGSWRGRGTFGALLNRDPRFDLSVQRAKADKEMRLLFPFITAVSAFLMRWLMWRFREKGESWGRRFLYSSAWGIGALVAAQAFSFLFNRVVAG